MIEGFEDTLLTEETYLSVLLRRHNRKVASARASALKDIENAVSRYTQMHKEFQLGQTIEFSRKVLDLIIEERNSLYEYIDRRFD